MRSACRGSQLSALHLKSAAPCRSFTSQKSVTERQRSIAQRIRRLLRRQSTNMAARGRASLLGLAATAEDMEGEYRPNTHDAKVLTDEGRPYENAQFTISWGKSQLKGDLIV